MKKVVILLLVLICLSSLVLIFGCVQQEIPKKEDSSETSLGQEIAQKTVHTDSLKVGDYVQFGSYEVEKEGYNPLLWIVIDDNSHYASDVSPEVKHLTLLTADIIDLRGFDAIEPNNANELRRGYGNSRYRTSNVRQWLNSNKDASKWWTAQNLDDGTQGTNNADAPPSVKGFPKYNNLGYDDKDGFLKGFSAEEKQIILDTKIDVGKNAVTEGGGKEIVTDKVFLLSLAEAGFTGVGGTAEGKPFSMFNSDMSRQAVLSKECIANSKSSDKLLLNKKWSWWLRSPSTGFPASVFMVSNAGGILYNTADMSEGSIGLRPALNIKKDIFFSGSGTREGPYVISTESKEGETTVTLPGETKDIEPETTAEIQDNKADDKSLAEGDKSLKQACQNAIDNYPQWIRASSSIVAWEDSDEIFYIRTSPDSSTWSIDNPAEENYKLINIRFIDDNTLGFTLADPNKGYKIGIIDFEFENQGTVFKGIKTSIKYENEDTATILDVNYITDDDFIVLYKDKKNVVLKHIQKQNEAILYQADYTDSSNQKIGLSPSNSYAYMVYGDNMKIFDMSKNTKIGELEHVSSAVWIGNFYILCSGIDSVFMYDLAKKTSETISSITPDINLLSFCPKNGGVISFNRNPRIYNANGHVISCDSMTELSSASNTMFETLADDGTAIFTKYKTDDSTEETGYYRFKLGGWGLHLSYGMFYYHNNPVLATVWNKY